ncbi:MULTISPECIES: hypothetical protein [Streptomycetaceae]|uniref:hypothetical protein n=1 Tax=Streptomycetaceae TaxID=2062 RepID=UPI000213FA5F|nr:MULTISPECIES: hypothetical protein [Streptomycetaceae]CCB78505.1 protein of unknown function [Streptantibioticus cattleyicolor NRRL 8057 = DSM 46488]
MGKFNAAQHTPPPITTTGHTYQPPHPLPHAAPGTLIAATDHGPDPHLANAHRWTVLYHTTNTHGTDTPVSGTLLEPPGPPPPGGRPVISWAHGTTGIDDACAPSHTPDLGHPAYARQITTYLHAGYTIAATDYPGLGTPARTPTSSAPTKATPSPTSSPPPTTSCPTSPPPGSPSATPKAAKPPSSPPAPPTTPPAATIAIAPASHLEAMLPGIIASTNTNAISFALYSLAGLAATNPHTPCPTSPHPPPPPSTAAPKTASPPSTTSPPAKPSPSPPPNSPAPPARWPPTATPTTPPSPAPSSSSKAPTTTTYLPPGPTTSPATSAPSAPPPSPSTPTPEPTTTRS